MFITSPFGLARHEVASATPEWIWRVRGPKSALSAVPRKFLGRNFGNYRGKLHVNKKVPKKAVLWTFSTCIYPQKCSKFIGGKKVYFDRW